MRDHLGVGGVLAQGAGEQLGSAHKGAKDTDRASMVAGPLTNGRPARTIHVMRAHATTWVWPSSSRSPEPPRA